MLHLLSNNYYRQRCSGVSEYMPICFLRTRDICQGVFVICEVVAIIHKQVCVWHINATAIAIMNNNKFRIIIKIRLIIYSCICKCRGLQYIYHTISLHIADVTGLWLMFQCVWHVRDIDEDGCVCSLACVPMETTREPHRRMHGNPEPRRITNFQQSSIIAKYKIL